MYTHSDDVITKESIQRNKEKTKEFVVKIKKDIAKAESWGKTAATNPISRKFLGGVTEYAFDAIPLEFCKPENESLIPFDRLIEEASITYMRNAFNGFKDAYMSNKTKVDDSELAEYLHGKAVDKLTLTDAHKKILKESPIKMNEFIETGTIENNEYLLAVLSNIEVQRLLKEEFK
jgi:hypothetical protein